MKRLTLLSISMIMMLMVQAQERRTDWDFTLGWSNETVSRLDANIALGGDWTTEKKGQWAQTGARSAGPLTIKDVNGEQWPIPETEGLSFGATAAKHIIVAYDYDGDGNDFHGCSFLWINGSRDMDRVTIEEVEPGDRIIIVYESHNTSQERGFKAITPGVTIEGTEGETTATTIAIDTVTFVTDDFEGGPVTFQSTSGHHIYRIALNELRDNQPVENTNKLAFIYDSSYPGYDMGSDIVRMVMGESEFVENTAITDFDLATSTLNADELKENFDVVVLSGAIRATEPQAPALRSLIASVPVLNLGTSLNPTWEWGIVNPTDNGRGFVPEDKRGHQLFVDRTYGESFIDQEGYVNILDGAGIVGIVPTGDYLANDEILATADPATLAIHIHNPNHNAYMLLPYDVETSPFVAETFGNLLGNAISYLQKSKRMISKAAKPSATFEYKDKATIVTLNTLTQPSSIYYTLDGNEPTAQATLYEGPFTVTNPGCIVKAITIAEGYYDSDVLTTEVVELKTQVSTPAITVEEGEAQALLSIACATTDAEIYYNYSGSKRTSESQLYTAPVVLSHRTSVTAFAVCEGMVQSEAAELLVRIPGEHLRIDTLAVMNSHDKEFGSGDIVKAYNYFSTTEVTDSVASVLTYEDGTPILDADGEPMLEWTYIYAPAGELSYKDFGNGWAVGSYGQRINNQNALSPSASERPLGTGAYGPLTIDDTGYTAGAMSFLVCKNAGDPASAWIQTTEKVQAPFDINIWISGQGSEGMNNEVELSVSADSLNWTVVDVINTTELKNIVKFVRSYEGSDEVFFRAASVNKDNTTAQKTLVFDILLSNHGPLSVAAEQEASGIEEPMALGHLKQTIIYDLNGVQVNRLSHGLNIVKEIYDNGIVKSHKVIVK